MPNNKNEPIKNQIIYNELCNEYNLIMHDLCKECANKCKQYYGKKVPLKLSCSMFTKQKVVASYGRKQGK